MKPNNLDNSCFVGKEYEWLNECSSDGHKWILPKLLKLLPKGQLNLRVLDIGCGNGFMASRVAEKGFEVIGIDSSRDGIIIAEKSYPNVNFKIASAYDELIDLVGEVDIVIVADVIEHLYSPKTLMRNINSVLKPGGMLIISTPYHGYIKNLALSVFNKWDYHHTVNWEGGHIKFFSEKTLRELLQEFGFCNISFHNTGRIKWLWKSMICKCFKS